MDNHISEKYRGVLHLSLNSVARSKSNQKGRLLVECYRSCLVLLLSVNLEHGKPKTQNDQSHSCTADFVDARSISGMLSHTGAGGLAALLELAVGARTRARDHSGHCGCLRADGRGNRGDTGCCRLSGLRSNYRRLASDHTGHASDHSAGVGHCSVDGERVGVWGGGCGDGSN